MKRVLVGLAVLAMVFSMAIAAEAKEYSLNIPSGPTVASGDSTFVITPGYAGRSGTTIIDRPYEKGEAWSLQVNSNPTSGISPYTAGQSGVTTYEGNVYTITLYFSNYLSGGSPYVIGPIAMTGNTTYAIPFQPPSVKYI